MGAAQFRPLRHHPRSPTTTRRGAWVRRNSALSGTTPGPPPPPGEGHGCGAIPPSPAPPPVPHHHQERGMGAAINCLAHARRHVRDISVMMTFLHSLSLIGCRPLAAGPAAPPPLPRGQAGVSRRGRRVRSWPTVVRTSALPSPPLPSGSAGTDPAVHSAVPQQRCKSLRQEKDTLPDNHCSTYVQSAYRVKHR